MSFIMVFFFFLIEVLHSLPCFFFFFLFCVRVVFCSFADGCFGFGFNGGGVYALFQHGACKQLLPNPDNQEKRRIKDEWADYFLSEVILVLLAVYCFSIFAFVFFFVLRGRWSQGALVRYVLVFCFFFFFSVFLWFHNFFYWISWRCIRHDGQRDRFLFGRVFFQNDRRGSNSLTIILPLFFPSEHPINAAGADGTLQSIFCRRQT